MSPAADAAHAPLAGASVILTRPAGSASALARQVRARGGQPVLLPGLSLRGPADADAASRALDAARGAERVVFVSPAAVRAAWRLCPELRFAPAAQIAAVGTGTARALARRGVRDVLVPAAQQNSDGLLALPEFADLRGCRVALVGAPGGRDTLPVTLRERGARLERIEVYRRAPPHWTRRHLAALDVAPKPWLLLISSAEALGHLVARLPAGLLAALREADTIVSSPRLAALATGQGFAHVHGAASALPAALLEAAAHALGRHRL